MPKNGRVPALSLDQAQEIADAMNMAYRMGVEQSRHAAWAAPVPEEER